MPNASARQPDEVLEQCPATGSSSEGVLGRGAPTDRGLSRGLRRRGAALPRRRHAPAPRSRPASARRCGRRTRRLVKVPLARRAGDPQARVPWLAGCARVLVHAGKVEEARPLARQVLQAPSRLPWGIGDLALVADELGCAEELAEQLERGPQTIWTDAARALLRQDFTRAADILDEIGDAELAALARLRAAEQLVAEGRRAEADEQLQRSLAFWRSVQATRYIRQAEALLAAAS